MKKRNIAATFGAALVGIAFGSTFGVSGIVSAGSATQSIVGGQIAHDNGGNSDMVNGVHPAHGMGRGHGIGEGVDELATILKLTSTELKNQLMSGKTLAEIATAQKVDVSLLVNSIVARMKAHIAEKVADGDLTQARADEIIAGLNAKVTDMVNGVHPAHGLGRGHGKGMHMPYDKTSKTAIN